MATDPPQESRNTLEPLFEDWDLKRQTRPATTTETKTAATTHPDGVVAAEQEERSKGSFEETNMQL